MVAAGLRLAFVALAVIQISGTAAAQQSARQADGVLFRTDVAGNRNEDAANLRPLMLGGVRVRPQLDVSSGYDSNVFNLKNATGDGYLSVSPHVDIDDDWGDGSLAISGAATLLRYAKLTSENSLALNGRINGGIVLSDTNRLTADVSAARVPEARGTGGVGAGLASPVIRNEFRSEFGGTAEANNLLIAGTLHADTQRYGEVLLRSGQLSDQRYRDLVTFRAVAEIGVRLSGNLVAFTQADVARERSVSASAADRRDAVGQTYSLGVRGDLSQLVTAQIIFGYRRLNYANAAFPDFAGLGYAATLDWYARPLVSIRVSADRYFANSGIVGAAGIDTRREQLSLFWDPTRIIHVRLSASRINERYRGADLTTSGNEIQLGARYAFARRVGLTGSVGYRDRSSADETLISPFRAGTILIGLSLVR